MTFRLWRCFIFTLQFAYSLQSKRGCDYQIAAHTLQGHHIFFFCIFVFLYFAYSPRSKRGRDHQMGAHTLQSHILWNVIPCQVLDLGEMIIISEQFTSLFHPHAKFYIEWGKGDLKWGNVMAPKTMIMLSSPDHKAPWSSYLELSWQSLVTALSSNAVRLSTTSITQIKVTCLFVLCSASTLPNWTIWVAWEESNHDPTHPCFHSINLSFSWNQISNY